MSDQESAAQEEVVIDDPRLDTPEVEQPEATPESAPEDTEAQSEVKEDGFQKRINKVTADKYAEKRRADKAEQDLEELRAKTPAVPGAAPKIEDFDYDQDKYTQAMISHQVGEALTNHVAKQSQDNVSAQAVEASNTYQKLVSEMGKDDFFEVANNIPALDQGLVAELMSTKEGVEMIYHLGNHLDIADKIANMSPLQAMGELGRISSSMSAQPEIKPSAAPDPIEPLNSGGSLSKERGPEGATYE